MAQHLPEWDGSPRAVVPSQSMLESTVPILATQQHAEDSPNEYGLAVFVMDDLGIGGKFPPIRRQLPMYYVSPPLAESRGRGLLPGWYVVPEVGKNFRIHTTHLSRGVSPSSYSYSWTENTNSALKIRVDGAEIRTGFSFVSPGSNGAFMGFTQSAKFTQGSVVGSQTIREFKFASVKPVVKGNSNIMPANPQNTAGCIELQIFYGEMDDSSDAKLHAREDTAVEATTHSSTNVSEKAAIKSGCSVKTARDGAAKQVPMRRVRGKFIIDSAQESKIITVYLREHYWLESRRIIDTDGNPWKPSLDITPVNLCEDDDDDNQGERARKKTKTEVVDLTLVNDNIDLTAY